MTMTFVFYINSGSVHTSVIATCLLQIQQCSCFVITCGTTSGWCSVLGWHVIIGFVSCLLHSPGFCLLSQDRILPFIYSMFSQMCYILIVISVAWHHQNSTALITRELVTVVRCVMFTQSKGQWNYHLEILIVCKKKAPLMIKPLYKIVYDFLFPLNRSALL